MTKLFGTDGIRGTPGEYPLTDEMIYKIGKASANLLHYQKGVTNGQLKVIIGKDTRLSCQKIEDILVSAISSCGVEVVLAGTISTPGLAFLTKRFKALMGIMISASHNKATDNGIKFFSSTGHKLPQSQEKLIEKVVFSELIELDVLSLNSASAVLQIEEAQRIYVDFLKSRARHLDLKGLKIVVDCAYGALSDIAPLVFQELGAQVYPVNNQPNGENINLNCGALHPENMARLVAKYNADIGFSYDGDGDRVIMSDEEGNLLDGDYIMAIVGLHLMQRNLLPKNTLVTTVMSNYGLHEAIAKAGGVIIQTDVGDRNVAEALIENNLLMGGEQSGHVIFLNHSTTGDAIIVCLEILKVMKETGKKLSELGQCMYKCPQVLINVKVKEKKPFEQIPAVQERISLSNSRLNGNGRLLLRYSGTEPVARVMVEGRNKALIEEIANSLAEEIRQEIGISE
jgi:phosphoglucosamine mutase